MGGGLRARDLCRVPKRYASAGELFRWWKWWRLVFILPFPASGADDLVIRVLMG